MAPISLWNRVWGFKGGHPNVPIPWVFRSLILGILGMGGSGSSIQAPVVEPLWHGCPTTGSTWFHFSALQQVLFLAEKDDGHVKRVDMMVMGETRVEGHGGSSDVDLVFSQPLSHAPAGLANILLAAALADEAINNVLRPAGDVLVNRMGRLVDS